MRDCEDAIDAAADETGLHELHLPEVRACLRRLCQQAYWAGVIDVCADGRNALDPAQRRRLLLFLLGEDARERG